MKTTQTRTEKIQELIRKEYEKLDEVGEIEISPAMLANTVYGMMDSEKRYPMFVQWACISELRQMARGICRQHHIEQEENIEQEGLFKGMLQERYPAERKGEDVYVMRAFLTLEERKLNIERLRSEGKAKIKHSDALQAETDHLVSVGLI